MNDDPDLPDALAGDTPEDSPPPVGPRPRSGWWILLVLLCPMFISLVLFVVDVGGNGEWISLIALLFASLAAGTVASCLLVRNLRNLTDGQRIVKFLWMCIVFTVASVALSGIGCAVLVDVFSLG